MTYELAKELKDAGFPQTGKGNFYGGDGSALGGTTIDVVYKPTLSELIEACVDFQSLIKRSSIEFEARGSDDRCLGLTPEEAVARLWLALNKKHETR